MSGCFLQGTLPVPATGQSRQAGRRAPRCLGASAPVTLLLRHSVDAAQRSMTLHCAAGNRTGETLHGVEVELVLGGPVAPGTLRPLRFALEPLLGGGAPTPGTRRCA